MFAHSQPASWLRASSHTKYGRFAEGDTEREARVASEAGWHREAMLNCEAITT